MSADEAPVIDVRGGSVARAGRPSHRDVDLSVRPGEVVAVLGANGSGKSTLVKTIVGLLPLSSGTARVFGEQVGSFNDWSRLGYVPQRSTIAQGIPSTVREVVAAGRLAHRPPFMPARAADRRAVLDALETVGLADRANHPVARLSGGQQQRVLMARTLAGQPELLVLDEPNAGVDLISQQAIADTLARTAQAGATIVVVLHELGPFEPLIGRTVVLREGRISYDGTPDGVELSHDPHGLHCEPIGNPLRAAPISGLPGVDR